MQDAQTLAEFRQPFIPGESEAYTKARKELLAKEIEFRRQMTELTHLRQSLPSGPVIEKDYRFQDASGKTLRLIDLFGQHNTLVTYFWMFGPERKRPCPMCTNWLGGVNGNAVDISQRASLKILGRSPVSRQLDFAIERDWRHLEFVQTLGDDYARDLKLLNEDGTENPALVVYKKDGDKVRLFYAAEMPKEAADPGQDPRTAPDIAPLWNILDLTPEGRNESWYPKLSY
jgi:predicted dithiol-disulfide oxidoreductase (DUF899 family)